MSSIKSKEFYEEAENLQKGWGRFLKKIDILKDKVKDKDDISLNDACYILWAEGICSGIYLNFQEYCATKKWTSRKMPWEAWKGLFDDWYKMPS